MNVDRVASGRRLRPSPTVEFPTERPVIQPLFDQVHLTCMRRTTPTRFAPLTVAELLAAGCSLLGTAPEGTYSLFLTLLIIK